MRGLIDLGFVILDLGLNPLWLPLGKGEDALRDENPFGLLFGKGEEGQHGCIGACFCVGFSSGEKGGGGCV